MNFHFVIFCHNIHQMFIYISLEIFSYLDLVPLSTNYFSCKLVFDLTLHHLCYFPWIINFLINSGFCLSILLGGYFSFINLLVNSLLIFIFVLIDFGHIISLLTFLNYCLMIVFCSIF